MRAAAIAALAIAGCTTAAAPAPRTPPGPSSSPVAGPVVPSVASRPPPPPSPPPSPPPPTTIAIRYRAADDSWQVEWQLGAPAVALHFDRGAPTARARDWELAAGLALSDADGELSLRAIDGQPRSSFAARIPTDDDSDGRRPPSHLRFADGSRAIFTGALAADAELCRDDRCRPVLRPRRWTLAADGMTIRVLTAVGADALTWAEPDDDRRGTYAYVGVEAGQVSAAATLVVDRALPRWLIAATEAQLAAAIADFSTRTGLAPAAPPLVLVATRPGRGRRIAMRGRTLPSLIVLEATGDWRRRTATTARLWRELVVHEAFHLWNGGLARRVDPRDEWLSEGASSFVAGADLRAAGALDAVRYGRRLVAAANRCRTTLVGPLYGEGADAAYYSCGELIQAVLDRALGDRGGVMALYARLFAEARARPHGAYATSDYLGLAAILGADPEVIAQVRAVLDGGLAPDALTTVRALVARAGVVAKVVGGRRPRLRFVRWQAR